MLNGQSKVAFEFADLCTKALGRDFVSFFHPRVETFGAVPFHVTVHFGRRDEIKQLSPPDDPNFYPWTTTMYHYARGVVAFAATGDVPNADVVEIWQVSRRIRTRPTRFIYVTKQPIRYLSCRPRLHDDHRPYT
jgi:hypothetical protein